MNIGTHPIPPIGFHLNDGVSVRSQVDAERRRGAEAVATWRDFECKLLCYAMNHPSAWLLGVLSALAVAEQPSEITVTSSTTVFAWSPRAPMRLMRRVPTIRRSHENDAVDILLHGGYGDEEVVQRRCKCDNEERLVARSMHDLGQVYPFHLREPSLLL